ncbi:MAG TPA: peptidylprolyl isomerase [Tepidisphaeraceae bacterium]|nr:peptidylprolyl isomerase [Tepidisphaeraceae bacterium]
MKFWVPILGVGIVAITAGILIGEDKPAPQKPSDAAPAEKKEAKTYDKPPEMKIDVNKTYTATIDTSKGKIVVSLFAKEAPKTVNSFVFLAREKFYDGVIFHRVIPGFMIQGGDPTGTGGGGPGYEFENENRESSHGFAPGTLAMANAGLNTNGSQFFIVDGANAAHLTADRYTIFGEVKDGQKVVSEIANAPRDDRDRPNEAITIKSVTIEEK